jgi:general secretion pathway protein F
VSVQTVISQNYFFRAVDPQGALSTGHLEAPSRAAAVELLSRRGLIPTSLEEERPGKSARKFRLSHLWSMRLGSRGRVSTPELLDLTRSLAALAHAGLTIDRALQITASLAARPTSRALAETLLREVRSGKTLCAAFSGSGQPLPTYYVSMVEAGEIGGSLPEALARITDLMAKQLDLRQGIGSALIYPSLLAVVVIFTLIVLLTFVLPRFEVLFAESGARLPWSTQAVLRLGRLAADYWWMALLTAVAAAAAFAAWVRSPPGRLAFDTWVLRARWTFGVPAALDTARLLRTVSALCGNGQPLPTALRVARGTLANRRLRSALETITREVQAGERFSVSLGRADCFPALAVQLARVGEETGHLGELLESAAAVLDQDAHRTLERVLSIAVPLLTVVMGVAVAGLIGSVLIGLLSINDLAF